MNKVTYDVTFAKKCNLRAQVTSVKKFQGFIAFIFQFKLFKSILFFSLFEVT